jgi:COP9 signalosome complex subunit 7
MGEKSGPSLNPLEQFVLLAKTAKGAAAVELVKQVLQAQGVFVFGELLDMQNIKDLEANESTAPYYHLLKLFAYGSYQDLQAQPAGSLPELTPVMSRKLRMLSVVTLAEHEKLIAYSVLQEKLGLDSIREVEDLIIEGISCGIMTGKLDQKNSYFEVDFVIGRDIQQSDFSGIIGVLNGWCDSCDSMLTSVESQIDKLNEDKATKTAHRIELDNTISSLKANLKNQPGNGGGEWEDPDSRMESDRPERKEKRGGKMKGRVTGSSGASGSGGAGGSSSGSGTSAANSSSKAGGFWSSK